MTAKSVNWSMATPNVGEPGMPRVWCVLKGLEIVSTIEMVLLAELDVSMAPVCGLIAREVGLTPTLVAVRVVGGVVPEGGKSSARLIMLMVFEPVFVTMAAPVASLMATPVELVPVVTSPQGFEPHSAGAGGLLVKSMTEAVPAPL